MKLAALALAVVMPVAIAQSNPQPARSIHSYQLRYATSFNQQNEVANAVRNMFPLVRMQLLSTQNQILVDTTQEENEQIFQMLKMLDVPAPLYRLTYIFTESENGKRVGTQQYSMTLVSSQRMQLKEGDRVPVMTGSTDKDTGGVSKQATYLDVGFNFDSTVTAYGPDAVRLETKVERSAIAQEKTSILAEDPLIRQSTINGVLSLTLGKPQHLGNIDVIGSPRQLQVDALVEAVK